MKELDFELVAPSLLQHKVISAAEYGALSRLPGEEQVGFSYFQHFSRVNLKQTKMTMFSSKRLVECLTFSPPKKALYLDCYR